LELDTRSEFWDQTDVAVTHPSAVIDLREVRFVDSAGLAALVSAVQTIRAHGGQAHLRCAPGIVLTRLDRAGIDRVAPIETAPSYAPAGRHLGERRRHNIAVRSNHSERQSWHHAERSAAAETGYTRVSAVGPTSVHHPARSPPGHLLTACNPGRRSPGALGENLKAAAVERHAWSPHRSFRTDLFNSSIERRIVSDLQALIQPQVLRFAGAVDAWRAPSVREAFNQITSPQAVIVDLERVTFIDSAGLGALIGGIRRVRNLGGKLAMCAPPPSVTKVFRMTGVDRLVVVVASLPEAMAALDTHRGGPSPHPAEMAAHDPGTPTRPNC
jgi:anti-sigma B factor antagonist